MSNLSIAKILILDDEADLVEVLEFHLKKKNFSTIGFTDPLLAEREILKGEVSLVLLDLNMPLLSGLELLRKVRQQKIEIPFIFLTGSDDLKDHQNILAQGGFASLSKPYDLIHLVNTLQEALAVKKESL